MKLKSAGPGPRYGALIELLRTAEVLWEASRVFFDRWDLSPSQFNVLNILHHEPEGVSQTELSRQIITHRSNVTGLVDRLEARGLVRREACPGDRRAYRVVLSGEGRRLVSRIQPQYYDAAESVWGETPVEDAQRLVLGFQEVAGRAERVVNREEREGKP